MQNPFDPGFYCSEELRDFGFAHVGENVLVSRDCKIIGLPNIWIGDNVRIDSDARIYATGGKLRLEGRNHIGGQTHLSVAADLTFSAFSGTSQGVRIYTATEDYSGRSLMGPPSVMDVPAEFVSFRTAPIRIGKHTSIGSGAVVLPGCHLEEGAILGALSLAVRPLKPWSVYSGVPARRVAERSRRALELEAKLKGPMAAAA